MLCYLLYFWIAAVVVKPHSYVPQQDISEVLARAEALYYEAKFGESVQLLAPLDDLLKAEPGPLEEKIRLKMQLALGYVALNDLGKAKSSFVEICTLDSRCEISSEKYPPKVVALLGEAKSEVVRDAANRSYQEGLEAYRKEDLPEAARKFRDALRINADHTGATQYLVLTEEKLRLAIDLKLLEWRKDFKDQAWTPAAAGYRQLESINADGIGSEALEQIRNEYRSALTSTLAAWNRACQGADNAAMSRLRSQATEMIPDPAFGQDLIGQMATCSVKPCIKLDAPSVMLRVRSSEQPKIPPQVELRGAVHKVRVQARIAENGDVTVVSANGESSAINDAVRTAVEKWKFSPAVVDRETRCVDTVFPIAITRTSEVSK